MVKTPKKAAPGGDERNMHVRRLKATSVPSNSSVDKEIGSEILTRLKQGEVEKKASNLGKKEFKSKLPGPKVITRNLQSAKQIKKLATSSKVAKTQIVKMQTEVEEVLTKTRSTKEDLKLKAKSNEPELVDLEAVEAPQDQTSLSVPNNQEDSSNSKSSGNNFKHEERNGQSENGDLQVTVESEPSQNGKHVEEEEVQIVIQEETKDVNSEEKPEKEEQQGSESQTDTESNVVESTTSEISEVSELPPEPKENEKSNEAATIETPCVSYDSSITLKNVQIKLNDCLKDNTKPVEENNEQEEPLYKDLSFGKTLRTISGRRSLNRLRHVTFREHNRFSPNSSLFVNTSSMSQDEDLKVLRYRTGLSDSIASNGTPSERKRKLYPEDSNPLKKAKTESESSFFNSSFELLKSFRRPIQVSTPNVGIFKFQTDKLNLGKNEDSNVAINADETPNANKWCAIM